MGGKAVRQGMNTDALGNAGTCRRQANEPVELARTHMLPAVARKQPGLAGSHPSLLARHAPPVAQQLDKVAPPCISQAINLPNLAIAWMAGHRTRRELRARRRRIEALERELMATQSQFEDHSVRAKTQLPVTRQLRPLVKRDSVNAR
jgi:hypothetical protein